MTNHEGSRTQEASQIDDDLDMQPQDQDIHIECQPFRTTPVVLPRGKTIHHPAAVVNKFTSAGVEEKPTAFRSSALRMAGPKTILEANAGGSHFQARESGPHPQYYSGYI